MLRSKIIVKLVGLLRRLAVREQSKLIGKLSINARKAKAEYILEESRKAEALKVYNSVKASATRERKISTSIINSKQEAISQSIHNLSNL